MFLKVLYVLRVLYVFEGTICFWGFCMFLRKLYVFEGTICF